MFARNIFVRRSANDYPMMVWSAFVADIGPTIIRMKEIVNSCCNRSDYEISKNYEENGIPNFLKPSLHMKTPNAKLTGAARHEQEKE